MSRCPGVSCGTTELRKIPSIHRAHAPSAAPTPTAMNPYAVNSPPLLSRIIGEAYCSCPCRSAGYWRMRGLARSGRIQLRQRLIEHLRSRESRRTFDTLPQVQYPRDPPMFEHHQIFRECLHSAGSWVITIMGTWKRTWISRSSRRTRSRRNGSSADSGSSSRSTSGWRMSARAKATRCRCPPERSRGWLSRELPSSKLSGILDRAVPSPPLLSARDRRARRQCSHDR